MTCTHSQALGGVFPKRDFYLFPGRERARTQERRGVAFVNGAIFVASALLRTSAIAGESRGCPSATVRVAVCTDANGAPFGASDTVDIIGGPDGEIGMILVGGFEDGQPNPRSFAPSSEGAPSGSNITGDREVSIVDDYLTKYGTDFTADVTIRFLAYADYAESGSGTRMADIRIDDVQRNTEPNGARKGRPGILGVEMTPKGGRDDTKKSFASALWSSSSEGRFFPACAAANDGETPREYHTR